MDTVGHIQASEISWRFVEKLTNLGDPRYAEYTALEQGEQLILTEMVVMRGKGVRVLLLLPPKCRITVWQVC